MPSPSGGLSGGGYHHHRVRTVGRCGPAGDPNAGARCSSEWSERFLLRCRVGLLRSFPAAGTFHQDPSAPAPSCAGATTRQRSSPQYLAATVQVGVNGSRQPQGMEAMNLALQQRGFLRDGRRSWSRFFTDARLLRPAHRSSCCRRTRRPGTSSIVRDSWLGAVRTRGWSRWPTYANYFAACTTPTARPRTWEVGAVCRSGRDADPGVCANPACDAACDAPPPFPLRRALHSSPTYQICIADCASSAHLLRRPGSRPALLDLAYAFLGVAANRLQRRREPRALPALRRVASLGRCCSGAPLSSGRAGSAGGASLRRRSNAARG